MSQVTVIALENDRLHEVISFLIMRGIPFYEIDGFFDVEGFKGLDEVEAWWLNK